MKYPKEQIIFSLAASAFWEVRKKPLRLPYSETGQLVAVMVETLFDKGLEEFLKRKHPEETLEECREKFIQSPKLREAIIQGAARMTRHFLTCEIVH